MMKKIIIVLNLFLFQVMAADKMLFVDANNNPTEIKVARDAAKAQGKQLVIYPGSGKKVDAEELAKLFDVHSFSSISFSGHSGALMFYGDHGELDLENFASLIKDKPSAKNIQSLYLLGCNSGNKSKIMFWKEALPNLKFIAGFDGVAPVGTNQAGLIYYADILKNEEKILSSSNANEIKKNLENLKNVKSFPTSLLVKCNETADYLYQPKTNLGKTFSNFTVKECAQLLEKYYKEYSKKIKELVSGEVDPKKETSAKLKEYYEAARQKEHCEEDIEDSLEANRILFLRFMQGFDTNFSNYFKKPLTSLIDQLKNYSNHFSSNLESQIKLREAELEKLEKDPERINKIIEMNVASVEKMIKKMGSTPAIKGCIEAFNQKNLSESDMEMRCSGENLSDKMAIEKVKDLMSFKRVLSRSTPSSIQEGLESLMREEVENLKENSKKTETVNAELKKYISTLEKIKSNPSSVSRAEVAELAASNILNNAGVNPILERSSKKIFESYANLDPKVFPYSWYDKPHGEAIEKPLNLEFVDLEISNEVGYPIDYALFNLGLNVNEV